MTHHEHRGIQFKVGSRTPFPGIGWSIPAQDHLGRPVAPLESQGAFYDDHPEGARAAARAACRRVIDRILETS
jgi:hypothetical protein